MKFLWIIFFSGINQIALAQDSLSYQSDSLKDIKDLLKKKYVARPLSNNEKPVDFTFFPAVGYSLQTGFAAVLVGNIAFRLGKGKDVKFSSINTSVTYTQYNQTIIPLTANIWSENAKWNYSVDWRYMQYPSTTWGLAGRSDPNDEGYTIDFSYLKIHQMVLRSITKNLFIGTGFFYDNFWNIQELTDSGLPLGTTTITQLRKQGLSINDEIASGIPVRVLYDSRLNQINPRNGWYMSLTWRDNLKTLGSEKNWQSLVVDVRKYFRITKSGNTLALWLYSWRSGTGTPYLLLPSTGWDDSFNTGRGYIQGRFRSSIMNYLEAEYRFQLTRNGLLGAAVFANVQSYKEKLTLGNELLAPAGGAGLRIKLNKNSGANLCIDYGIGQNGSRGFFVNLGEVF